ncbi:hypothetical protein I5907_13930 [Panacibacter sp. DH6]|uniref:Uncharacterized protein n=1 Tax=Panacibacter microcysteis TaxID=2793269 RepID=A0A931GYR2_9BACT|nr:hypothetical protein [Panacibacter microcysteis]MBG9377337.1 hypothetical protein [Panacibacter microcysteis]
MNRSFLVVAALAICSTGFFTGCEKDKVETDKPALRLTPDKVSGKSGFPVSATLSGEVPNGVKNFYISKTVNLKVDSSWGTNGVLTVSELSGQTSVDYTFDYVLQDAEVDKLVGFNYRIEDGQGKASEKDLTVNTIASGAQIIASHPWKLTSKIWKTDTPPSENLQECEKDNVFTFKRDSTILLNYGAAGCLFDGLNIYDKWTLSEDEKTFTQRYYSVFDPSKITIETYTVTTLTKDKWVMEIVLDLSVFGLSDHEVFEYTYEPA